MPFFIPFLIGLGLSTVTSYFTGKKLSKIADEKNKRTTNTADQQQELLKPLEDRVANLDKGIMEKVNQQIENKLGKEPLTPREKKELIEKIPQMSKEEKAELMSRLKEENSAEQEAINKALKDKLDKQDKRNIQLAEELRKAKEGGDPTQIAKVAAMVKDNDKNQQATRLALKKSQEEGQKQAKLIEEYLQNVEKDKPWIMDMNFKSPWLWGILILCCLTLYLSYRSFMWAWGKIKGTFSS